MRQQREHGADAFILEVTNEGKKINYIRNLGKVGNWVWGEMMRFLLGCIDRGALTW